MIHHRTEMHALFWERFLPESCRLSTIYKGAIYIRRLVAHRDIVNFESKRLKQIGLFSMSEAQPQYIIRCAHGSDHCHCRLTRASNIYTPLLSRVRYLLLRRCSGCRRHHDVFRWLNSTASRYPS